MRTTNAAIVIQTFSKEKTLCDLRDSSEAGGESMAKHQ